MREYTGGTRVFVMRAESGGLALSVVNRAWSMGVSGLYAISLVRDGARRKLTADPRDVGSRGLAIPFAADFPPELAAAAALEVHGPDGALLERLDLAGLAPAIARLGPCIAEAATETAFPPAAAPPPPPPPPPRRRGKAQRAIPRVPLYALITAEDYPLAALRADEQGVVGFRLDVGEGGRAAACTITRSSGSAALDAATCRLMTMRASFHPATNRKGKAVVDSVHQRIVWRIEPPAPPAPPPPR